MVGSPNVLHVSKRWATWPPSIRLVVGALAAVVVALAVGWVLFVPIADWLATHDAGNVTGALRTLRLQAARDAARGRLLTFGAGLFAAGALIFTARNFSLSREGQVTDRYTKAIEQLGSDKLDVRIGGIYALERIARDSPRDHPTVMAVLAAFIREHSRELWPLPEPGTKTVSRRTTRPDVQAALTVIGRRDVTHDRERLSLRRAVLVRATLRGANLTHVNLTYADLTHTNLTGADLTDADLTDADLTGAAWPEDAPIPEGWESHPAGSRLLRRASEEPGDAPSPDD
jgi:hypothetical protein